MPSLLLLVALLAADPLATRVLVAINDARDAKELPAVTASDSLTEAAEIQAEFVAFAARKHLAYPLHVVSTAWVLEKYPDLLWNRLLATYGGALPPTIGAFDLARLCGWEGGAAYDIQATVKPVEDAVVGWDRSPGHAQFLYGDYQWCGVGVVSGGKATVVAIFGKSN